MICMAAAGRKKGLSERIGKIFAEIINIFTGSFWTECPEVDNGLKNRFSTSFINRIDGIMTFDRLSEDDVRKIISNKLEIINKKHSDINITYADDVIDKIIKESDFYEFGARRLDKIISRGIENIIFEAIINNVKDVYIDKLNEYEKNITKS